MQDNPFTAMLGNLLQGARFVGHCDVEKVRDLLDQGADANGWVFSSPFLIDAASQGEVAVAELLLDRGADIHVFRGECNTALGEAARNGHTSIVQLLLERGADVDSPDAERRTPLFWAALGGNIAIMEQLVQAGAAIEGASTVTQTIRTPLQAACGGHEAAVQWLLERGANPNAGYPRWTALLDAVRFYRPGSRFIVELLLDWSADPNAGADAYETILLWVARRGDLSLARRILECGGDPNGRNAAGQTALHAAAERGDTPLVALLLEHGANANAQDDQGARPLAVAAAGHHISTLNLLLTSGADPDSRDGNGYTALMWAAILGRMDQAELVLERQANPNLVYINKDTALMTACNGRHDDIAARLLDRGAAVQARDAGGYTPLHYAAGAGAAPIVARLLERGADAGAKNRWGDTAGDLAARLGHRAVVKLLKNAASRDTNRPSVEHSRKSLAAISEFQRNEKPYALLYQDGVYTRPGNAEFENDSPYLLHSVDYLYCRPEDPEFQKNSKALMASIRLRDADSVHDLLAAGTDPNVRIVTWAEGTYDGWNAPREGFWYSAQPQALALAMEQQDVTLVQLLLDWGARADIATVMQEGPVSTKTFLDMALEGRQPAAAYRLLMRLKRDEALSLELCINQFDAVRFLVSAGAELDAAWKNSLTTGLFPRIISPTLAWAIAHRDCAVLCFVLDCGFDVNARGENGRTVHGVSANDALRVGRTLLMTVVSDEAEALVPFLLDRGARVNDENQGETALLLAIQRGMVKIVQLLLERGADVTQRDALGRTPLEVAHNTVNPRVRQEMEALLMADTIGSSRLSPAKEV